ncbi:RNA polymerase sigma-70 factor (ECF subfamily) [Sphingomonas zeicaulis]|uniref:RNA polymerase sigma factor n=1 Tax=Sphingomonas zeicaulis TaxID=1632740 RepID=UPI003D1C3CFF
MGGATRPACPMKLRLWSPQDPEERHGLPMECDHQQPPVADVETLYRDEAPRLRRFFRRQTRQTEDAPDLVQRCFARLIAIGDKGSIARPRAYLSRIALNLVRDDARAKARHADVILLPGAEAHSSTDPHGQLEARDMLARIDDAMLALPERTREIFMAHRFDDLTYNEIAEQTGLSVKTVEKHMSRALAALNRLLTAEP